MTAIGEKLEIIQVKLEFEAAVCVVFCVIGVLREHYVGAVDEWESLCFS